MTDRIPSSPAIAEPTQAVFLTDTELSYLDGRCSEKIQAEVTAALRRIAARSEFPGLSPRAAGFVADVVSEARENGELLLVHRPLRRCDLCGRNGGYRLFKSGRRKGEADTNHPLNLKGYELARRFVGVTGWAHLGGCADCIDSLLPVLADALRGIPAQVPERLRADGEPRWIKHRNRHCNVCGWDGHEGEMARRRTLMGDGTYAAVCPSCKAETGFLDHKIEVTGGFVVVSDSENTQ